jgi:WD40 repeat protein
LDQQGALEHEAFSADGKRLIVVDTDHTVRLWDLSPCANRAAHAVSGLGIQPGMTKDFSLSRLAALVEVLAGASIDQEEQLTPLKGQDLLAAWQRFQNDEQ